MEREKNAAERLVHRFSPFVLRPLSFSFEVLVMGEKKKPIKLYSWRQGIVMGIAVCAGVGFSIYRTYARKGYIDKVDVVCTILAVLIGLGICLGVAWWGNRPEKEE